MDPQIKNFLEHNGFKLESQDDVMSIFRRKDKSTIVEFAFFSNTNFNVNIKSNAIDSNLAFGKNVTTKQTDAAIIPFECKDVIHAFYLCKSEFGESLLKHVENLKSISSLFLK